MLSRAEFDNVTQSIRSSSASMEARFVDIGSRLGTAVDTIDTLTRTFDVLANELNGENLRGATRELSQIMSRVTALADVQDHERAGLTKLESLTGKTQQRIEQMGKAVRGIGMLAINARIEAVNIGTAGADFVVFTSEIGRTLGLAQNSLDQFTKELSGVCRHLQVATDGQRALARHQAAAIQSVPTRLAASVSAIANRAKHAIAAASAVTQKSREVMQSISDAVLALQIGDTTRQRLEHVEYALGIIVEILHPAGNGTQDVHGDWSTMTVAERNKLAGMCCRLMSAQLLDASDEFDGKVHQILASIHELAADAQAILRLGNAAAGASGNSRGTFLGEVEEQVAEVDTLLNGLRTARQEADQVAATVSQTTARLYSHSSTLASLEEDIRIMGLNTSLKCGRLGDIGRPLMVIAQELRNYSSQIATEGSAVAGNLDGIVATAAVLSGSDQEGRAAGITAVASTMADSVAMLGAAGGSLADALATLACNTDDVSRLLSDIAARATVHEQLGKVVRQAAADLAKDTDIDAGIVSPQADHVLDLFMRSYTMERERLIHDQHSNGSISAMSYVTNQPAANSAASADLDDVFF